MRARWRGGSSARRLAPVAALAAWVGWGATWRSAPAGERASGAAPLSPRDATPRDGAAGAARASDEIAAQPRSVARDGLTIDVALRPLDGPVHANAEATAVLRIADAASGAPVRALRPLAWMSRRGGDGALDDAACKARVKSYLAGLLSARADVDMSAYDVWVLGEEGAISVVDPTTAFARTRMQALISLPGRPADWAMRPDGAFAYVTLPDAGLVSVVDVRRRSARVRVRVGVSPSRVAIAPDGGTVWVSNDGDGTVSVIDTASNAVRATLDLGAGHHEIAFADQGRTAWIAGDGAPRVTAVDARSLDVLGTVEVGEGAASVAASDAARAVLVANGRTGEIAVIDPVRRALASRVRLAPGLGVVRFEPGGRFAFVAHRARGEVAVLDASSGRVVHTLTGLKEPDSIAFTRGFAYVRQLGAPAMSVVALSTILGSKSPAALEIPIGTAPPGAKQAALAAPIAATPEDTGVMVANPADGNLYYYVEGMMAPLGTQRSYSRVPLGVAIAGRGLREVEPGSYEAAIRLKGAGVYDVAVLLQDEASVACLEVTVPEPSPREDGARRIVLDPLFDADLRLHAGERATLRFRLREGGSPEIVPPEDIEVMFGRFPGSYRLRRSPRHEGDGIYAIDVTPPSPGQYRLLAGVEKRGAPLGTIPHRVVGVVGARGVPARDSRIEGGGMP